MTPPSIHISNAALSYAEKMVFANINLEIPAGKCVALLGRSGIGKTSLLRMIAGLTVREEKTTGTITADNHLPVTEQIAYLAQTDLLLPWLTVLDNTLLKTRLSNQSSEMSAKKNQALTLLNNVGLKNAGHLYPHQLSGGMRQRAALVRTLMDDKPIVLMDEPFSALDAITRYKLQNLAATLLRDKTVLFITHDPSEALRLADEIYIMQESPNNLKCVATFTTTTPRELDETTLASLQTKLFQELANAESLV